MAHGDYKDKRYYFSSSDRSNQNDTTTSFTILPTNQIEPYMKAIIVRKVTIPYTVYTVNNNNNKLYWVDSDASAKTTTLTNGNYNQNDLATLMTTAMNADKSSANTYTVTVSSVTAKFTITNNTSNFQLTCTNNSSAIWKTIGFSTTSNRTGSTAYTGDRILNLQPLNMIYICSNLADGNNSRVKGGDFPILCSIPISENFGDIITYINDFGDAIPINNTKSQITFQLFDNNLNNIDLNGTDWSIEIDFSASIQL